MRKQDILTLFGFTYWANRQLLSATREVSVEQFTAPSTITYRDLRGTLVHTLDVEWSWRIRLRGEQPELWETSLVDDDYPTVAALAERWSADESAMREWLESLTDSELTAIADIGTADRFPLWYYLIHIVTHSEQQRRDAAILLANNGQSPPDLEFLYYADTLKMRS
ncbi:MAG: DinB family protein [Actinomycetota bacterium]|nr:DinB family protein [Actinomycetota bacterium]